MAKEVVKQVSGILIKNGKQAIRTVNPLDAVENISKHITEWKRVQETERTKRTEIDAKRDIIVSNIQAERDTFIEMLKVSYKEREYVYKNLFDRLDAALETGQIEIAQLALSGIVEQIRTNPMPSFGEFRKALTSGTAIDF